ncbi:MAG: PAS domain S-box protein [Flavobacteriales bacterium]|nr:PAS domain S-box protein [Flavobacteriales bacterium]MCB9363057.1 PAS domain S-box protein [Flavobacteriales bacterium]
MKNIDNYSDLLLKSHELTKSGIWVWDVITNKITWDNMLHSIFESPKNYTPNFEEYISTINEKDREGALKSIQEALSNKTTFTNQYSIYTFKNQLKHIQTFGNVQLNNKGEVVKMMGVCMDITSHKSQEIELKTITNIISTVGGQEYFDKVTQELTKLLAVKYALVGEYNEENHSITTLGYAIEGKLQNNFEYQLTYTPCDVVVNKGMSIYHQDIKHHFPKDEFLKTHHIESYIGIPLYLKGELAGIVVLMDDKPLKKINEKETILKAIIDRTQTEIERIISDRRIKEVNNKFETVIKGTSTGLWEWNLITNEVKFNEEWAALLGYELDEIKQDFSFWEENVHPEDLKDAVKRVSAYLQGESETYSFIHRMKHKNGEWLHILTQGSIVQRQQDGTPILFMGTHTNVNKQEQYLQTITEYEKYFSVSMDVMSVANGEYYIKINSKFTEVLGYTQEDLASQPFTNLIHPDDLDKTYSEIKKITSGEPTTQFINRYRCKDGNYKHLMWTAKSDPKTGLRYGAARDITELVEAKERSQQYLDILYSSLNEMYIIDAETLHFIDANIGAQNNIGFTVEELKRYTSVDLKPDIELEDLQRIVEPLISGEKKHITFETRHLRKDGSTYMAFVNLQLTKLGTKDVFVALALDITNRINQEKELKETKQNLENIVDYANVGIAYASGNAQLISVNPKFVEILEYEDSTELIGKPIAEFTITEDFEKELILLNEIVEGKRDTYQIEKRYVTKNKNIKWVDLHVSVIRAENGKLINFVSLVADITERKENQEKLARIENERFLVAIQTEENERKRISQDLHDGLGQTIAAASLYINTLDDLVKNQLDEETYAIFKTGKDLVNKSAKETRMVSHNIMPPSLNQFGLNESINELISNYQKINENINITYSSNINNYRFKQEIELSLYRVVQELINNAYKHSKAQNIYVSALINNKICEIMVKDDGVGFNYDEIKLEKKSGIGLRNIEQRIYAINGKLEINYKSKGVEFLITKEL